MPLIDPHTPQGFFHMRLAPLNQRMLNDRVSFFATAPDRKRTSYFELTGAQIEPEVGNHTPKSGEWKQTADVTANRCCNLAPIRAQFVVEGVLRLWRTQEHYANILSRIERPLIGVQAFVIAERNKVEEGDEGEKISDYLYPIS